ncbi:hypothetical protein LCGC14_2652410, partial [marine sediment metagenome]
MSSLIPERPLIISPSLATTIGLEEALLLQVLNDATAFSSGVNRQGYRWFTLQRSELQSRLPFWNQHELQRISKNLKDQGIILIESAPLTQSEQLSFAMNEPIDAPAPKPEPAQPAVMRQSRPAAAPPARRSANLLAENWQPDEDLLQLMALNHNIPRDFALQQREDFLLY